MRLAGYSLHWSVLIIYIPVLSFSDYLAQLVHALYFLFFCNDAFFMLNLKESDFGISTSSIPHTFSNNRKPVVKKNDPVQMGLCGWKCTKYVHKESTAYICQLSHRLS